MEDARLVFEDGALAAIAKQALARGKSVGITYDSALSLICAPQPLTCPSAPLPLCPSAPRSSAAAVLVALARHWRTRAAVNSRKAADGRHARGAG